MIAGAAAIEMPNTRVAVSGVGVPASVIWKTILVVPLATAIGVPESTPAAERLRPAGSV